MRPNTYFKINDKEDIVNHYLKYSKHFAYTLEKELEDYEKGFIYMICNQNQDIFTDKRLTANLELIPNPYRTKPEPTCELGKAMKQAETEANKLGMQIEFVFKSNK